MNQQVSLNPLKDPKEIFSMDEKVVVIMGGVGKMGQEFSEVLSNSGAKVWMLDLDEGLCDTVSAEISKKSKMKVRGSKCDVTSLESISLNFNKILEQDSRIDVLIYNVYSKPPNYYKKFNDYSKQTWNKVVDTNFTGAFLSCQEVVKIFRELNIQGNIILTLSTYGLVCPDLKIYEGLKSGSNIYDSNDSLTTPMSYTATKSGLLGIIKWLSGTHGKYGIRVNGISPGGVYDGQEDSFHDSYVERVPLGRMATWDEYNGAILFLASEASRYMTGANLVIDGGWTVM